MSDVKVAKRARVARATDENDDDHEDAKETSSLDERHLGRTAALGIPVATLAVALVVGVVLGLAQAILVLAAGALLGVIALLWGSVRVLSGDVPLPPELEALDTSAHEVDALASRRTMLLRALKDLEAERDLGKLEASDYEEISRTYRTELKDVLRKIDASLAPYRAKAEQLARRHLEAEGLDLEKAEKAEAPADAPARAETKPESKARSVTECAKCQGNNDPDARFCKHCGASMTSATEPPARAEKAAMADKELEDET